MPDHADWPPAPRALERASRLLGYAATVMAGYGVLTAPGTSHPAAVQFLGLLAVIGGVTCFVATAGRDWMIEAVAIWLVLGAFAGYSVLAWAAISPRSLDTAGIVTVATAATVGRIAGLLMFSIRARTAKQERAALWQRVTRNALDDDGTGL